MPLSITSMTFDKSAYSPGETITLTVDYTSTDVIAGSITANATVTVSDTAGSTAQSAPFTVDTGTQTVMPTSVTANDDRTPPGTWTLVSNTFTGTASPFTGTAVLTSVA